MDLSLFPDQPEGRKQELDRQSTLDLSRFPDQPLPEAPSYGEVAWTGLREGISGALKPYEAPFKPVARALGIPPGLELSEWIKPSEEEERRAAEASIPKQIARGLAGLPGAALKYGPTGRVLGPVAGFVLPEVTQAISEGKTPSEIAQTGAEAAVMGLGFKYLPSGMFRVPGMAGLFGAQSFYENMKQGVPVSEALKRSIAPATVGGVIGLLPSGVRKPAPEIKPSPIGPEVRPPTEPYRPQWVPPEAEFGIEPTEELLRTPLGKEVRRADQAAIQRGISTKEPLFEPQYRLAPTWYSSLQRTIDTWGFIRKGKLNKLPDYAPVEQVKVLLNEPGVKADEIKWTGLDDWLKGKMGKVSKTEVMEFLKQNEVRVEEVAKGGPSGFKTRMGPLTTDTKFAQWQLPGGENYRELLLTLPTETKEFHIKELPNGAFAVFDSTGEQSKLPIPSHNRELIQSFADSYNEQRVPSGKEYRTSHWDEPNVLAHVRFNDRVDAQGKKVLFIEEVQSDWHQAGREKGYKRELSAGEKSELMKLKDAVLTWGQDSLTKNEENRLIQLEETGGIYGVPLAPFAKTWHELMMKRMVRWASENGYDKVAWTTGEQQIERYIQAVKQLDVVRFNDKTKVLTGKAITGEEINETVANLDQLRQYIGKNAAEALMKKTPNAQGLREITGTEMGEAIRAGGAHLRFRYDDQLPQYMNTFGKKWGAKVGETEIDTGVTRPRYEGPIRDVKFLDQFVGPRYTASTNQAARNIISELTRENGPSFKNAVEEYGSPAFSELIGGKLIRDKKVDSVHSLDITPSMKESALGEGFPMFRAGNETLTTGSSVTVAGKEGTVSDVNPDGTVSVGFKDGTMANVPREQITAPLPMDTLQSIINKRTLELKSAPQVMITETSEEFPSHLAAKGAAGVYDRDSRTIWVARDRMTSELEVINTINHEAIGHYALNSFMDPSFDPFLNRVFMKYGRTALEKEMGDLGYRFNFDTREGKLSAAREKLAILAESGENPSLLKQAYAWIREQLAKVFPGMEITDAEIQRVISQARSKMEDGVFRTKEERIDSLRRQVRNIQAVYQGPVEYRLGKKEVTDMLTPGMDIARDFRKGIASLVLPTSKSPEHLRAAEVLGSKIGPMLRDADIASKALSDDKKMFTKMGVYDVNIPLPDSIGMKFGSDMSMGRVMELRLQQVADKADNLFGKMLTNLEQAGAPLETIRPNYFPGMWTKESIRTFNVALKEGLERGGGTADRTWVYNRTKEILNQGGGEEGNLGLEYLSKRPFKGKEAFRKEKVFDDIMDAVEWGLEPVSRNPIDLIELKLREMGRSLMANRELKEEEGKGNIINVGNNGIPLKKSLREGFDRSQWDRVNDPYGTIWHKNPDTGLLEKIGERLAKRPVADVLNNYLSTSLYNTPHFGSAYRAYMWTATVLNQFQLGLGSAFHAGFTTIDAQISTHAMVIKDIYGLARGNRTLDDLGRTIKRVPLSFAKWTTEGKNILKEWETPTMEVSADVPVSQLPLTKEGRMAIITKAVEVAGGGFELEHGLRTREIGPMIQSWYGGNKVKAALRSPFALVELSAKPIMEWLVPKQKAGVFGEMVGRIIEQNPDKTLMQLRPELRQAWNRVDARMGQVRYDRLFMNNVAKNVVQSLFRAPGWTGGTMAEIGGSIVDATRFFKEWVTTGKLPANIPDRVAYTVALMTTVATANALLTIAFTGDKPSDLEPLDFWAFRTGELDERMRKERFLLPTYAKDIYSWQHGFAQTLLNKTHPLISLISDIARNKDYYGVRIHDPDDDSFVRYLNMGGYVSKQFIPFWMRGMATTAERAGVGFGEAFAEHPGKMLMPEVGIMPAPAHFTASKAEQLASELTMRHLPAAGITKAQRARTDLVKQFARRFNKGESSENLLNEMQIAISEGKLDRTDLARVKQRITREPIQQTIMKLDLREALRVWEVSTPEEKLKISPFIMRKFWRSRSPEEREEAAPQMQNIMSEIPTMGGMPSMAPEQFSIIGE